MITRGKRRADKPKTRKLIHTHEEYMKSKDGKHKVPMAPQCL